VSGGPTTGRGPALITCLLGGFIAFALALAGLVPEGDFSVREPLDLVKLLFLFAPAIPFLLLSGVAAFLTDRVLLTGTIVIAVLLILSCGCYLAAQAEQRVRPDDSMHALTYLVIPFLQTPAMLATFGLLALCRSWRKRGN
jgi:Fe2+ transport system protein B